MRQWTILVTDGEQRSALATVRSLGAAGHRVYVCSPDPRSIAGGSRYSSGEGRVPDPLLDRTGFLEGVRRLIETWNIELLMPISEATILELSVPGAVSGVKILGPDLAQFKRISDKAALLEIASKLGIAVPRQVRITEPMRALDDLAYPLVIKPARSVTGEAGRRRKFVPVHVATSSALRRALDDFPHDAYPLLAQQRIVGPGIGIFLLRWQGRTLARFAHRRLREKPPSGGVSVYRESVPMDEELAARCESLLDGFNWSGVAMIEFKIERASGIPYLMEINGRLWGSLQLAIDSGVDFPVLLLAAATGQPLPPVTTYRTGVRSRWEWGDVDHLVARLRKSARSLSLADDAPGRIQTMIEMMKFFRAGDRLEVFRPSDPKPFARETRAWLQRLFGRRP